MAKFSSSKNTFQNGELSEKLVGRQDIQEYPNGSSLVQDFIPLASGGASKRPGSRYSSQVAVLNSAGMVEFIDITGQVFNVVLDYNQSGTTGRALVTVTIVKSDGTTVLAATNTIAYGEYDDDISGEHGWHYLQVGRILLICHRSRKISPIVIYYNGSTFTVGGWAQKHSGTLALLPGMPPYFMTLPYSNRNISTAVKMVASATAVGGCVMSVVDGASQPVQFFTGVYVP